MRRARWGASGIFLHCAASPSRRRVNSLDPSSSVARDPAGCVAAVFPPGGIHAADATGAPSSSFVQAAANGVWPSSFEARRYWPTIDPPFLYLHLCRVFLLDRRAQSFSRGRGRRAIPTRLRRRPSRSDRAFSLYQRDRPLCPGNWRPSRRRQVQESVRGGRRACGIGRGCRL